MTLRNTEQANQYGRHCMHSGARHVLPRIIAPGNVSAASECPTCDETRFPDTVGPFVFAIEIYEGGYAKFPREEILKSKR